ANSGPKHALSSKSAGDRLSSVPLQEPPGSGILLQLWKCPISSSNAMLYVWIAHGTFVCVVDVEYIGWKSYGSALHSFDGFGAYFTCPKPFAALAVIEPFWPVVRSSTSTRKPCAVSCIVTLKWSPWFRNSTLFGSGRPDFTKSKCTGSGGPCG